MNENLQMNSDFAYSEYAGATVTFGPPPISGSVAITVLNGVTGPTVNFVGGSSGFTFSPAGTTIILGSPLTTKGDILTRDGSTGIRLAVGSNGDVLTADSSTATGLKWAPASGAATDLNVVVIDNSDSPYTLTDANDIVLVDATGGDVIITLSDPATAKIKTYYFKLIATAGDKMILDGDGFDIDGLATQDTLVQYVSITLVTDGSASWWIV